MIIMMSNENPDVAEDGATPRAHTKEKSSIKPRVILALLTCVILAQWACISTHSNRLKSAESELKISYMALNEQAEQHHAEEIAYQGAYKRLSDQYKLLLKIVEEEKTKRKFSDKVSAENEQRVQNSFEVIRENLALISQLTDDLSKSTVQLEYYSGSYEKLHAQFSALLEHLKSNGIDVNFVEQQQ